MAVPTFVDWVEGKTSSADGFVNMPITIPASRLEGDLMLCWVGSHSGSVSLPAGFTELDRPAGGAVLGYAISTVDGAGTATATSSGGSHGGAWLALFRGADRHDFHTASNYLSAVSTIPVAEVGPVNARDSLHLIIGIHRRGGVSWSYTPALTPAGTYLVSTSPDWGTAWWRRTADTGPAVSITTTSGAGEMAAWNLMLSLRSGPTVGFIGFGTF